MPRVVEGLLIGCDWGVVEGLLAKAQARHRAHFGIAALAALRVSFISPRVRGVGGCTARRAGRDAQSQGSEARPLRVIARNINIKLARRVSRRGTCLLVLIPSPHT